MPWIIHAFELFEESNEEDEAVEEEEEEDDGDEQIAMAGTTKSESKV